MKDNEKTKDQLINELSEMRQRIAELEALETQRKQTIEALQNSEQPYSILMEVANNLGEGIAIFQDVEDRKGDIIFTNDAVTKILGYSRKELLQMSLSDLVPPTALWELRRRYRCRQTGEKTEENYKTLTLAKDRTEVPIQVEVSSIIYQGKPANVGFIRNIIESKQVEESLQRSSEHFQALIENSFDIIIILNVDGSIGYASPSIKRLLGYELEELVGKSVFDFIHPESLEKVASVFYEGIQVPGYVKHLELKVQHKDGSWRTAECIGTNLLDNPSVAGVVVNLRDITDRKQAEEALQRSKEHFQALIENTFDTIIIINDDGSVGFASSSIKGTLGYEPEEFVGKNLFDLTHPDDMQKVIDLYEKEIQDTGYTGYTGLMEVRARHKDGSWRIIESINTNLLRHPSVAGIVSSFRDITDYRQKEKNYRELIEDINDGYIVYQDGVVVLANRRFSEIIGYEREHVLGQDLFAFMAPDDRQELMTIFIKVGRGEDEAPERYEAAVIKADGTPITLETSIKVIEYEGKPAFSVIVRDITDRKKTEEVLKHSKEHFQALVENTFDTIMVLNSDGSIGYVSPSLERTLGYKPEEWIGKHILEFIHPDNLLNIIDIFNEGMQTPGYVGFLEMPVQNKDGSWRTIEGTGTNLLHHPSVKGIVANFHDITERKKAEQELQELYEREIKLHGVLEEDRKRRIEFTRVLVHELRTPLTPVLAASHLLVEELRKGNLMRLARAINRGALNLNNRIDDLLGLVKGEIGMLQPEFKSVDPMILLRRIADNVAPIVSSNEQFLILDLPKSLPLVQADENRLQQVILNLLNNASKFTPDGGKITLRARRNSTALIVEVQDTGGGISEEERQRLFEPYYRVESDRQYLNGLGIGLSMCKTLVELHGGRIWVDSSLGDGSTFSFSLPLEN